MRSEPYGPMRNARRVRFPACHAPSTARRTFGTSHSFREKKEPMKYRRTAAAIAGSVVALGAASPAFASGPPVGPRASLNGGLDYALGSGELLSASPPVGVEGPQFDALVEAVKRPLKTGKLIDGRNLLGGLPPVE
ncbi:hypothetical protein [Streptomyces spirodelae]|uniref:Uncharacterized protein n=1 Tax=Streptomyces spirodelae TaxID=2812904 RepID=A0ABS3X3T1_9ACTN|nr:hypothetical protein [Streptomyces spirodelae]MBO8190033.1 hypothetical protein [Streptomyces spirodelae]